MGVAMTTHACPRAFYFYINDSQDEVLGVISAVFLIIFFPENVAINTKVFFSLNSKGHERPKCPPQSRLHFPLVWEDKL